MPTKTDIDYTVALPSLTSLNLSHNRLSADSFSAANIDSLPPALSCLDLSSNNISGRIPLKLFNSLSRLQKLYLASNGLDDDFFIPASPASGPLFPSLGVLDISRNALDSLEHLELVLKVPSERQAIYSGISSSSLLKALTVSTPSVQRYPPLNIDLTGNFLREELPRRKLLRKAKRQESTGDVEVTSVAPSPASEGTEAAEVLRLLDEVHQTMSDRLRHGQLGQDDLSVIKTSLDQLRSIAARPSAEPAQSQVTPVTKRVVAQSSNVSSTQSDTPVKPIVQEVPGSSRARKLRLQQEAQDWAPL